MKFETFTKTLQTHPAGSFPLVRWSRAMLAALLFLPCGLLAQAVPDGVARAAEDGFRAFVAKIPEGSREEYGFKPEDSLGSVQLGDGFQLHTITPQALQDYRPGAGIRSLLTQTSMWYFPLKIGGEPRTMIVVDRMDGQWKVVSIGQAGLATELAALKAQWPREKGFNPELFGMLPAGRLSR